MPLTTSEIESLRLHMGYGNIGLGAYPYTPDGFYELFYSVVAPNLYDGAVTSATTVIAAGTITVVTPVAMTDIVDQAHLVIDGGDESEIVVVKAITLTTFTAKFAKAHAATGYPVALNSGTSRLRYLLTSADAAWQKLQTNELFQSWGLKGIGRKELEWFEGYDPYEGAIRFYHGIVEQIAALVRVQPAWAEAETGRTMLEAY